MVKQTAGKLEKKTGGVKKWNAPPWVKKNSTSHNYSKGVNLRPHDDGEGVQKGTRHGRGGSSSNEKKKKRPKGLGWGRKRPPGNKRTRSHRWSRKMGDVRGKKEMPSSQKVTDRTGRLTGKQKERVSREVGEV